MRLWTQSFLCGTGQLQIRAILQQILMRERKTEDGPDDAIRPESHKVIQLEDGFFLPAAYLKAVNLPSIISGTIISCLSTRYA